MKSREVIVSETLAIIEQLSMFGVLKMWWVAKHLRKVELEGEPWKKDAR